jgi:hypothetical protein
MFDGDLDPEIAALLGTGTQPQAEDETAVDALPVDAAPAEFQEGDGGDQESGDEVDLGGGGFPEVTKVFEEKPLTIFADANYYKGAMTGEGDKAQRVHGLLQKYLNAKDPKDKGVFRQQLTTAYWDFLSGVGRKAPGNLPDYKKFLLRFNILHPTLLNPDDRAFFAKLVVENELNQPVYYLDEWFKAVGTGAVRNSTTDEAPAPRSNAAVKLQELLDKAQGKKDGARSLVKAKDDERIGLEQVLKDRIKDVTDHYPVDGMPEIHSCYTEIQRKLFLEIQEIIKNLLKMDHDVDLYLRDYYQAMEDVKTLEVKLQEEGAAAEVDTKAVEKEFDTIRQMHKMTVGRQGNAFPILTGEYFRCTPNDVAYRENVITLLAKIESIDPGAFCRPYKNRLNRIAPYVVLIPSYGEFGFCWEPFDRFNRATSRGRLALPMYPKNLYVALLAAVADMRWQVAKEKASYYWMEEGLTGNYFQWFQKMKLKADLKETFIGDYILWMTKESEGIQKLDKEVRGIFWRLMPFSQALKDKLKERAFAYQELYQRDLNRAMSDGY